MNNKYLYVKTYKLPDYLKGIEWQSIECFLEKKKGTDNHCLHPILTLNLQTIDEALLENIGIVDAADSVSADLQQIASCCNSMGNQLKVHESLKIAYLESISIVDSVCFTPGVLLKLWNEVVRFCLSQYSFICILNRKANQSKEQHKHCYADYYQQLIKECGFLYLDEMKIKNATMKKQWQVIVE